jgi:hypothetical protein
LNFSWLLYCLASFGILSLLITILFPSQVKSITQNALPRPWRSLGVGFIAGIAVPIFEFLLLISSIGIPIAVILGLVWLLVLLLSFPVFAYYLGRLMMHEGSNSLYISLVGVCVLVICYFIPLLGAISFLTTIWLGSGMQVLALFSSINKHSKKQTVK